MQSVSVGAIYMNEQETNAIISEGTKWLLEMELINNPHIENVLMLNVHNASPFITRAEIVTDMYGRKMLIFIEMNWLGRTFFKKRTLEDVMVVIKQALPSFQIRVTDDKQILARSVEIAKKILEQRKSFTRN